MVVRRLLRVAGAAALVATSSTCATNPATGGRMFSLISEGQEIAMGQEADGSIVAQMGLLDDPAVQQYVSDLGMRLARASERPNLPWAFRVVDDPVVNAFALPGGFIYISRGILAHFNSEAELSSVLGHEIGHVTARHSVQQISQQQLAGIGLAVGSIVSPTFAEYAGIAGQGLGLLFLKFSRDDERQADDLGLRYMRRGGYAPAEMGNVYVMLGRVSAAAGGGRIPDWQSTHPNPEDRQERINRAVAALPPDSTRGLVRRAEYLARVDGIVFGDNPREGYFKGERFYHPDLKFQLAFPPGWKTANMRQAVAGQSPGEDAQIVMTVSGGSTPDSAANAFFGSSAVRGQPQRRTINGLAAIAGPFSAQTQSGQAVSGSAAFISYGSLVYEVVGIATANGWRAHGRAIDATVQSFAPLTDPAILAVQPHRLDVVRIDRDLTVQQVAQRYPGPASVAQLAMLNNVDSTATLPRGTHVKRVVGRPFP